jgi:hypothetical protein
VRMAIAPRCSLGTTAHIRVCRDCQGTATG